MDNLKESIEEWEERRKSSEQRIALKQSSLESWKRTNNALKESLKSTFRLIKVQGHDPEKLERDLELIESDILSNSAVLGRQVTEPFATDNFGVVDYAWKTDEGVHLDALLVEVKLSNLESEIDNLRQLQERNEILYGVLQKLKTKAWGIYMQLRKQEKKQHTREVGTV
ncbi:hypothetical protein ScPMuIL_003282 [Solemya velum]